MIKIEREAIIKLLDNNDQNFKIPGLGIITIQKMLDRYGLTLIDDLCQYLTYQTGNIDFRTDLLNIPNTSATTIDNMLKHLTAWAKNKLLNPTILVRLMSLEFSFDQALNICTAYNGNNGQTMLEQIEENPYQLINVEGISFKKADKCGLILQKNSYFPPRLNAALQYTLKTINKKEGSSYTLSSDLINETVALLQNTPFVEPISKKMLKNALTNNQLDFVFEPNAVKTDVRVFSRYNHNLEENISYNINNLLKQPAPNVQPQEVLAYVNKLEKDWNIHYDTNQKQAIVTALTTPLSILTGGPGTGKTTITKAIVAIYDALAPKQKVIQLGAPTGHAAKHLGHTLAELSVTKNYGRYHLPTTLHSLFGIRPFAKFEPKNKLKSGLLIIDESSMIDLRMMETIARLANQAQCQVILIGDKDQLPSVEIGQCFNDMINSQIIPTTVLTNVYRQADGSYISKLANAVNEQTLTISDLTNEDPNQVTSRFITRENQQIPQTLENFVKAILQKGYSKEDIQVLAPTYAGSAGIFSLNTVMQNILNPQQPGQKEYVKTVYRQTSDNKTQKHDYHFRVGDKVLNNRNFNTSNNIITNGDIGFIVAVDNRSISVCFDVESYEEYLQNPKQCIKYENKDINKLELAYCLSVHKAQGCEYPIEILVIGNSSQSNNKQLLYTAITRAKNKLIMLGKPEYFVQCITNTIKRKTNLTAQIIKNNQEFVRN